MGLGLRMEMISDSENGSSKAARISGGERNYRVDPDNRSSSVFRAIDLSFVSMFLQKNVHIRDPSPVQMRFSLLMVFVSNKYNSESLLRSDYYNV